MIKKILKKIYIESNNSDFDNNHLGTFNFWRLFFYNIISPGRTFNRFKFGQLGKNKKKLIKEFNKCEFHTNNDISKEDLRSALIDLNNVGGCVIKNYFSKDLIDKFLIENKDLITNIKNFESENISYKTKILKLSDTVIKLWLDKNLVNIIKVFLSTKVYARNYPYMYYTFVPKEINENKIINSKAASAWHVDHSVLFNLHVLLEDINENETCMEILPGSHKSLNIASKYSNSVVEKYSAEKIKCFGPKGTIYMHTGNVVHRLKPVAGKNRLNLHFEFSPGSNILLNSKNLKECLDTDFDIDKLENSQKEILKVIFPLTYKKGYDIKNDKIFPTKFLGI